MRNTPPLQVCVIIIFNYGWGERVFECRCPETGVAGDCKPPDVGAGMNPGPSEEQRMVLTAESAVLPSFLSISVLSEEPG